MTRSCQDGHLTEDGELLRCPASVEVTNLCEGCRAGTACIAEPGWCGTKADKLCGKVLSHEEKTCRECGTVGSASAPVLVVVIYAPSLPRGCEYVLPSEDYPICTAQPRGVPCPSIGEFVELAIAAHPVTRANGVSETWTSAVIVTRDGNMPPWRLERRTAGQRGIASA